MIWCALRYGASPNNYRNFNFKEASPQERATYLTHRYDKRLERKYNSPDAIHILQDKCAFAEVFAEEFGRNWADSSKLTYSEFKSLFAGKKLIYKPVCGGQGQGIKVYNAFVDDAEHTFRTLKQLPRGIVEEWIKQDEDMNCLYPQAINPIRVQTLNANGIHIIASTLTIGNGLAFANASTKSAIFALVDVETGTVCTDGIDYNGACFSEHPISRIRINGFQIPCWEKVLKIVTHAASKIPELGHVGWDIAITKNGPIIIEGNHDPGYTAYQLYALTKCHRGIKPMYDPYL